MSRTRDQETDMLVTTSPVVTTMDRCDSCGAAPKVQATLPSGGELLFCAHHAREHTPRLLELRAEFYPWR
jgi:hypothetical protein